MIDFKKELQNYPPVDLNRLIQSNPDIPDNVRNSILLYNKALENFYTKSEDIAIIELRKAISLNPDFHEATNLLGVFYIYIGENKKAEETFLKVIDADNNSIKALEYLKDINPEYDPSVDKKSKTGKKKNDIIKKEKTGKKNDKNSVKEVKNSLSIKNFSKQDFIKIAAGLVLGSLLVFLLSIKFYFPEDTSPVISDVYQKEDVLDEDKVDYEAKFNELNRSYQETHSLLEETNDKLAYYTSVAKLLEIEKLVADKKYEEAADMLITLKNVEFTGIEKEKYDKLLSDTMSNAAWNVFSKGRKSLEAKQYQEALDDFIKSISYVESDWKYSSLNLYYTAYCYMELDIKTLAEETFNEVIERYPTSKYAGFSKDKLKEMGQTP